MFYANITRFDTTVLFYTFFTQWMAPKWQTSEKLMKAITASAFCFSFLFCFVFILFNHLLSVFPYVTENRNIIFSLSPNLLHPFVFYKSEVELISRSSASQISDGLWTHHSPLQLTRSSGAESACCSDSLRLRVRQLRSCRPACLFAASNSTVLYHY